jgi:hypothetical protein
MADISKVDLQLVPFLRNLADSIEKKELLPDQLQKIGEFYMSYKLSTNEHSEDSEDSEDSVDVVKFLTLGWYMYTHILKNDKIPFNEID